MKKYWEVFIFIIKVTFVGFGGGNALFPVIKREAVDKKKWLTIEEFDNLVIATNMIPGPSVVESLGYIAMKRLGKVKGSIIALLAILPHVLFALAIFVIAEKYLDHNYLMIIAASVIPVVIGLLISFMIRYIKMSRKIMPFWVFAFLFLLTLSFTLFIPSPYNIPAIVMVAVVFVVFSINKIRSIKEVK